MSNRRRTATRRTVGMALAATGLVAAAGCSSMPRADDVVPTMRRDADVLGQQLVKAGATVGWALHDSGDPTARPCARSGQSARALLASAVVPARGTAADAGAAIVAVMETRGYDLTYRSAPTASGPAIVQVAQDRDRQTEVVFTVTVLAVGDQWSYTVLAQTACLDG